MIKVTCGLLSESLKTRTRNQQSGQSFNRDSFSGAAVFKLDLET